MSARPTARCRAGVIAAVATALLVPSAALADKDEARHGKPAHPDVHGVCAHLDAGGKWADGLPPGIAKKLGEHKARCEEKAVKHDHAAEPAPAATVAAPAPAPAAVVTVAASSKQLPCLSRRVFRVRLDRKGRVRTARVMLNGRAIPVTRGRNGRSSVLVDLRKRAAGTYSLRTTVVTKRGRIVTGTRRYRTCAGR